MKTKTFDCVEMQHRGGQRIQEATKGMTFEQEVAYWRERDRLFREEQERLAAKASSPLVGTASVASKLKDAERLIIRCDAERRNEG